MNITSTTNQRLVTILLVLLIILAILLTIRILFGFSMGGGMMGGMMGMNSQTMNNMMAACAEMMRNFQNP